MTGRESAQVFTVASEGTGGRWDDWILTCASCDREWMIGQGGVMNMHRARQARDHDCDGGDAS